VWGNLKEVAPRPPRRSTSEAKKFASRAFLTPLLLAFGEKRFQLGAMDEDRPAPVDWPSHDRRDMREACALSRTRPSKHKPPIA
jgi:hypothetical protein